MANHNKRRQHNEPMRTRIANARNRRQARENGVWPSRDIGFGFASDWLSRWREFVKPITERSKAEPKLSSAITFDTHYFDQFQLPLSIKEMNSNTSL